MIIGFDGSRAFSKNRTGTENYSYYLLKALSKIDRRNSYKVFLRPGSKVEGNWPSNFRFKVINFPRFWTQVGLALKTAAEPLDVLFVPAHTLPVIRKPGLKTVVTVHDLGSQYLPQMHQLKQKLYLDFMQKLQLKGASKIIAVSKATKKDLVKKIGLAPKNIEIVYEGFNKILFKPVAGSTLINGLRQFGLVKNKYFLFIGTVQPRKNLERIIKAYGQFARDYRGPVPALPQSTSSSENGLRAVDGAPRAVPPLASSLVIVGSRGWLSDELYQLPEKLGIEEKVKFMGYIPDEDLPTFYSGALALVFPSLFEGFGLPILEAQGCGCPVITSNLSSMPEVAGSPAGGGAILIDPYKVDDITNAMMDIMDDKRKEKLTQKGFENVKRFSWEKCARETLKILEEVNES